MHREFNKDGLGFGFGPHRCIAETLSKAELEAVFSEDNPSSHSLPPAKSCLLAWLGAIRALTNPSLEISAN